MSLPKDAQRRLAVESVCDQLGLPHRVLDGVACSPGAIGCGLSHVKALRAWDTAQPLLILEDDVAASADYRPIIDVPDDADALYLGASVFGAIEPYDFAAFTNAVVAEPVGAGLVRIHNMFATHAIIHLTERWRVAAIEAMIDAMVDRGWPPDRGLARIQSQFRVYALQRPAFYQAAELQPPGREVQEESTRAPIPTHPLGTQLRVHVGSEVKAVRLVQDNSRLTWVSVPA